MSTQTANNMRAFAPADRIAITVEYMAGREARRQGKDLGANPYRLSEWNERMEWFLGFYDEAHGTPVGQRAADSTVFEEDHDHFDDRDESIRAVEFM